MDFCKIRGSEIGKFDSHSEEIFHKKNFKGRLPFWIGYHGHKYKGRKFVWSDGSEDLYNKLDKKGLKLGFSAGLCTLVTNSGDWERRNCSETHIVLCRQPGKL